MPYKRLLWIAFAVLVSVIAVVQFIPSEPVVVPASLPLAERPAHRLLNFEGVHNFRDLGGYRSEDGRSVKWGVLYRSGNFGHASRADQAVLADLGLVTLIDFRSAEEKQEAPNQFPEPLPFEVIELPMLDAGKDNTGSEIMSRLREGELEGIDPGALMTAANEQFASTFTPQYRAFMQEILAADGAPVLWHCTAGKDRTGFASAVLLRILGVPMETVVGDYLLSRQPSLAAHSRDITLLRLFKGDEAADKVEVLLGVERSWLEAGFDQIDADWGSFEGYISRGLALTPQDVERLRDILLE